MPPSASADKAERLLNLVMTLKATRRPLSKQQIREAIPQYGSAPSFEAFDRMFERDKDELRDLGIPVSTAPLDVWFDNDEGYRIDAADYELQPVEFAPDELAALSVAARTWSQASFSGPAAGALRKLRGAGVEIDDDALAGIEPRIPTREPAFDVVSAAAMARQQLRFDYRRADGQTATRRVQPWIVKFWHGRWYLTAFDLDRDA